MMTMVIAPSRLACWFEADSGTFQDAALTTAAANDADPIGGWADKSGNGFNAVQNGAGNRPTLKLNQINSLPAVRFSSAAANFLSLGNVLGKPRSWTIFALMATTNPSVTQSPYGSDTAAGATAASWGNAVISQGGCPAGSIAPDYGDGGDYTQVNTQGGVWAANAFALTTLIHKDSEGTLGLWKNGSPLSVTVRRGAATQCIGPSSNFSLGREGDYNGIYLDGSIAAFALYDVNLLPVDRAAVEAYFKTKYGL